MGNGTRVGPLLRHLQVEQGTKLLRMIKVELVEAADAREEHAVGKLPHVHARLLDHGRIGGPAIVLLCW